MTLPVIFVPHGGGPMPLLDDPAHAALTRFMRDIPRQLGSPRAILLISAHWETAVPTVTGGAAPELIYDYRGFPPESYQLRYPAPGDPALAEQVVHLLGEAGEDCLVDHQRGFDHGMFVPLMLMYPRAKLPCVQLSLRNDLDPAAHIRIGEALAPLREQGVLIIGSGLSFHNMQAFFSGNDSDAVQKSLAFDGWLRDTLAADSERDRDAAMREWHRAPAARFCHPREEHLMPLLVCLGAGNDRNKPAEVVFNDKLMGMWTSGFLWH